MEPMHPTCPSAQSAPFAWLAASFFDIHRGMSALLSQAADDGLAGRLEWLFSVEESVRIIRGIVREVVRLAHLAT